MLLPPVRLQHLTWEELDSLLIGQDVRRQKDLAGFRLIAVQVHNMLAEKGLKPHEYLPLPAVDGNLVQAKPANKEWLTRMKQKYGDKLEA